MGKKVSFVLILMVVLVSCNLKKNKESKPLYLNNFEKRIEELEQNKVVLKQFMLKDNELDTVVVKNVDWKKELSLFFENPLLEKKTKSYDVKSYQSRLWKIEEYNSKDDGLELKKVSWKQNADGRFIYNATIVKKNRLSLINYKLEFDSYDGYLIESAQSLPQSYNTTFRIEGKFIQ